MRRHIQFSSPDDFGIRDRTREAIGRGAPAPALALALGEAAPGCDGGVAVAPAPALAAPLLGATVPVIVTMWPTWSFSEPVLGLPVRL